MTSISVQTLIKYVLLDDGRLHSIPTTIQTVSDKSKKLWKDSIGEYAAQAFRKIKAYSTVYEADMPHGLRLIWGSRGGKLWWMLLRGVARVGAGVLKHVDEELHERGAFLIESLRGKGLYPAILRALQSTTGKTIQSDSDLITAKSVRMWKRIGLYDNTSGRFRIRTNPARRVSVPRWALDTFGFMLTRQTTEPVAM